MSAASTARENGWGVGTLLAGDEGYGETVIRITAIGDDAVLAVMVSHRGEAQSVSESMWNFDMRTWRVVGGTDGPDQGDPAAWKAGGDAVLTDGTPVVLLYRTGPGPSLWWVARPDGHGRLCHVDALRAPGAVAAAPPGDEEQDPDGPAKAVREVLTGGVRSDDLPWEQVTPAQIDHYRAVAAAARAVPPAPPAGHEDEAAVERGIDALVEALGLGDDSDLPRAVGVEGAVRAVLAAARGPRTPGGDRG